MFRFKALRPGEWVENALCAQVGGDLWFAEKGDWATTIRAKLVCRRCPVREQCLSFALENGETHGVWGGMTPDQRKTLRRGRGGLAS